MRGLGWEGEDSKREKFGEGSGQPWRWEQGLVLQWLSLSDVVLASEDGRPGWGPGWGLTGLRGGRRGARGLWPERREVHGRGRAALSRLLSSNTDVKVGEAPSWLRSCSSCIL